MKRSFILAVALLSITGSGFGQRIKSVTAASVPPCYTPGSSAKTTAPGSIYTLKNRPDTAARTIYKVGTHDSGYVTGTNFWGDKAFAERYDVSDSGSAMRVFGVVALFAGKVNPASTHAVTFKVWDQGSYRPITGSLFYSGFPQNVLTSVDAPVTQLGIGPVSDTLKTFYFSAGTNDIHSAFFIGYGINYNFTTLNGDTLGLQSTFNGYRLPNIAPVIKVNVSDLGDTTRDTLINVQNATLGADNIWYDNYTQNDSLLNNLIVYPIVVAGYPVYTGSITRNDLTFFGNYPNPCTTGTNVRFALSAPANVTIQVMDIAGRQLFMVSRPGLAAGNHIEPLNTASLPAGQYIYLVRTSTGSGIAGRMTVQ